MQPTARRGAAHRLYLFPLRFWTPTQNRGNYGIATFRRRANGANCVDDRKRGVDLEHLARARCLHSVFFNISAFLRYFLPKFMSENIFSYKSHCVNGSKF